jgi:4-diphosphocytidyl-2-C-methyl-D-erythritol kinase
LERQGAKYASLSGSGSTLYGVFESSSEAERAAQLISADGHTAMATRTISRQEYWKELVI